MPYLAIASYGVIGDLHSAALVGTQGSIDWCCLPHFDSPSVFAAILDDQKGGFFRISPTAEARQRQMYLPETNVLLTRFLSEGGVGEITDFMPIQGRSAEGLRHDIVRQVRCVRGEMSFRMECRPAFDYARVRHKVTVKSSHAVFSAAGIRLALSGTCALKRTGSGVIADFTLQARQRA